MTKDEIIIAQQARIEQLKDAINNLEGELGESWLHRNYPVTYIPLLEALAIPDDLSALRAHDAAIWRKAAYEAGAASRDAEVAELQKAIDDNWITHQQVVAAKRERDQLREQVVLLREALLTCSVGDFSTGHVIYPSFDEDLVEEALAATEPKITKPT